MGSVLVFESVYYSFESGVPVLKDINLKVGRGEWVSLIGPTGSGKSTLGRLGAGLLVASGGQVLRGAAEVGWMAQNPTDAIVGSSVGEDVAFGPYNRGLRGTALRRRVMDSLTAVGLDATYMNRDPLSLSGGEQQRVVVAGLLAMRPSLLILDEPTAMLDRESRQSIMETLDGAVRESGLSLMHITHHMEEAQRADRVVVLEQGRVIATGVPQVVLSLRAADKTTYVSPASEARIQEKSKEAFDVELANVTLFYGSGGKAALKDVSLSVRRGCKVAVLGRSGAGKSTLLMVAAGLRRAPVGTVTYGGRVAETKRDFLRLRRQVGVALQQPEQQLFADSVWHEVMFGPLNLGVERTRAREMAAEALSFLGLDPEAVGPRNPFTLSGGERRQVALASALASRPHFLVLDEPTAGMDGAGAVRTMRVVDRYLQETGGSCLVATHDTELAQMWADQTLVLRYGQMACEGSAGVSEEPFLERADEIKVSRLHNMDARVKIMGAAFLAIGAGCVRSWPGWLLLAAGVATVYRLGRIPSRAAIRYLRPFLPMGLLALVLSEAHGGHPVVQVGGWVYTTADMRAGLWAAAKMLLVVGSAGWLTLTTAPMVLVGGLRSLLRPVPGVDEERFSTLVLVALRFQPLLRDEADWLRLAQTARGADLARGLSGAYRRLSSMVIPLFAGVLRRADALAETLVVRGYQAKTAREVSEHLEPGEVLFAAFLLLLAGVAVFWGR